MICDGANFVKLSAALQRCRVVSRTHILLDLISFAKNPIDNDDNNAPILLLVYDCTGHDPNTRPLSKTHNIDIDNLFKTRTT